MGASAFGIKGHATITKVGVTAWSVPEELKKGRKAKVTVIGGGGSGGRTEAGGGGGGGGVAVKWIDLTNVDSVQVTVGSGGAAPDAGTTPVIGAAGGTSSFGTYCSATGGGAGGTPSGGSGGIGIGGDMNYSLGPGTPGMGYGTSFCGGSGGGPGGSGINVSTSMNGNNAIGIGGGGGGACVGDKSVNAKAGNGYNGTVIIEW